MYEWGVVMKLKSYISGILTAVLVMSTISVFADTGIYKNIRAYVGGTNLVIDGVKVIPKDVNGNIVEPIVIDGTTYVPIRFISNVYGKKVAKLEDTIYIGSKQKVEAIYLTDQTPYMQSAYWTTLGNQGGWKSTKNPLDINYSTVTYDKYGVFTNKGIEYNSFSAIISDGLKDNYASYLVNKNYNKVTGYFAIDDLSTDKGDRSGVAEIYLDGKLAKRIQLFKGQAAEYFEVDISNIDILNIKVKGDATTKVISDDETIITSQTVCEAFDLKLYPK